MRSHDGALYTEELLHQDVACQSETLNLVVQKAQLQKFETEMAILEPELQSLIETLRDMKIVNEAALRSLESSVPPHGAGLRIVDFARNCKSYYRKMLQTELRRLSEMQR